ncbi:TRAP transporter small permease subunit [Dethiosulfatarculus sandiegensis]|uniref:C4-dicarboxylate ABC transporter substrate-binding protein n=1 Tax=Dethiosulfatarculus sandiegensis TaxID=1429043 RepID=A0A0D2JX84_9BACT|nr:TRAP transporter small permease subunit [Dethiosulfatarculus sandiegensis]KIX14205.1 C4-dicarboxylate ABC transporter substrate-binding protein [Dethiosulfatarculus sandiegensis]
MNKLIDAVDGFTEYTGRWIALLILPLIFVVLYEVLMRRVFNAPTTWAFEVTVYCYGAHFILGMAYTMLYDSHVRIDIIVLQMPERIQLWLRVITFVIIFLPFVGILTIAAVKYAAESWIMNEHSWSAWKPPLYPYKTVMPIGLLMLMAQGIACFLKDLKKLKGGKDGA